MLCTWKRPHTFLLKWCQIVISISTKPILYKVLMSKTLFTHLLYQNLHLPISLNLLASIFWFLLCEMSLGWFLGIIFGGRCYSHPDPYSNSTIILFDSFFASIWNVFAAWWKVFCLNHWLLSVQYLLSKVGNINFPMRILFIQDSNKFPFTFLFFQAKMNDIFWS